MSTSIDPRIHSLDAFKGELLKWHGTDDRDERRMHRSYLLQRKIAVRQLILDVGRASGVIVEGSGITETVRFESDPFEAVFRGSNEEEAVTALVDMIDETIGAISEAASTSPGIELNPGSVAYSTGDTLTVTSNESPFLDVRLQQGRLELVDPPPNSPLKLNRLPNDLPDELAAVTKALRGLITAVNADNSTLGETIKRQLIAMLEVALQDLKAPYADVGRLARTRDFIKTVGTAAATGAATATLTTQFENAATALGNAVDWLIKLAS